MKYPVFTPRAGSTLEQLISKESFRLASQRYAAWSREAMRGRFRDVRCLDTVMRAWWLDTPRSTVDLALLWQYQGRSGAVVDWNNPRFTLPEWLSGATPKGRETDTNFWIPIFPDCTGRVNTQPVEASALDHSCVFWRDDISPTEPVRRGSLTRPWENEHEE